MTEPLDLDAIKARLDAATPGPWVWDWDDATTDLAGELSTADGPGVIDHVYDTIYIRPNDRTLIAHAPTDIAALVAEVERLRRWKREAMLVMGDWEQLYETLGRPGMIGQSKAYGAASYVGRLQGENMRLRKQVESLESTLMKDH